MKVCGSWKNCINGGRVRGLWREAELPVRFRINQHGHEKENLRVMLDWHYWAPRLYETSPVSESFHGSPFLLYFLLETPDGLVHLFLLLFTECSGRKMKFMVIGLCQAGQGALFPSGCTLPLFLLQRSLSLSLHFHLIPSVFSYPSLFHNSFHKNFYDLGDRL